MLPIQSIISKSKERKAEREHFAFLYHMLMRKYGYIPLKDFKEMPIPLVFELKKQIEEEAKEMRKEWERRNDKRGNGRIH